LKREDVPDFIREIDQHKSPAGDGGVTEEHVLGGCWDGTPKMREDGVVPRGIEQEVGGVGGGIVLQ